MKGYILLFLVLIGGVSHAADTLFLRSLALPDRANNIDSDGRRLIIRLSQSVMVLEQGELHQLDIPVERRFSWVLNQTGEDRLALYHTSIPVRDRIVQSESVSNVIPGFYTSFITTARLGSYLYICYRGQVLEYLIQDMVSLYYHGMSVRHIYCDDTSKVVSTYDGIFKESTLTGVTRKIEGTFYSSGELNEIDGRLFLCQDGLHELVGDTIFTRLSEEIERGAFRKLLNWNDKTICLFNNRLSVFDINKIKEGRTLIRSEVLNDALVWKNKLYAGDSDGNLFIIPENGRVDTIRLPSGIWDLEQARDIVYLGCDSGIYAIDTLGNISLIRQSVQGVQIASMNRDLFISNFTGLFFLHQNDLYPIIQNVEFNHRAMTLYNNHLYAGSIDGLYSVQIPIFINDVLPTLKPTPLPDSDPPFALWKVLLIVTATTLSIVAIVYVTRKKKQDGVEPAPADEEISPEMIERIVRSNEKIVSVQSLAENLESSVVQLNRKLKPFGTTPLMVMQEVKKKIAKEMYAAGEPLENIARRTGYSSRYVREHFLNDVI